jgi:hypothetical protein
MCGVCDSVGNKRIWMEDYGGKSKIKIHGDA